MNLSQFLAVSKERILTPDEFIAFVESQGWRVEAGDGGAFLAGRLKGDPLAQALAKMLGREPYRTNVLGRMRERWGEAAPAAAPASAVRLREWKWPSGMVQREGPEYAAEDIGLHPGLATHWRYVGETEWRPIDRRVPCGRTT